MMKGTLYYDVWSQHMIKSLFQKSVNTVLHEWWTHEMWHIVTIKSTKRVPTQCYMSDEDINSWNMKPTHDEEYPKSANTVLHEWGTHEISTHDIWTQHMIIWTHDISHIVMKCDTLSWKRVLKESWDVYSWCMKMKDEANTVLHERCAHEMWHIVMIKSTKRVPTRCYMSSICHISCSFFFHVSCSFFLYVPCTSCTSLFHIPCRSFFLISRRNVLAGL